MCILCCPFQKMNAFSKLFDDDILLKYQLNEVSKARMSKVISQTSQDNLIAEMNRFRNTLEAVFHTPLLTALSMAAKDMKFIYNNILIDFIRGQDYYGSLMNSKRQAQNMQMWRIPVRILYIIEKNICCQCLSQIAMCTLKEIIMESLLLYLFFCCWGLFILKSTSIKRM